MAMALWVAVVSPRCLGVGWALTPDAKGYCMKNGVCLAGLPLNISGTRCGGVE